MPGKVVPCALCQTGAAAVYCVNDDANLCTECDASVHAGNPLLARHERRPLSAMACQAECASAACTAATDCTDADVCVVPQFGAAATPAAPAAAATKAEPEAAPLVLYEDAFLGRSLTTSDLLDLDELELPGCTSPSAFSFDDCVVPSFGAWAPPAGGDRYLQVPDSPRDEPFAPAYAPSYLARAPQPYLVKQHGGAGGMVPTAAGHGATKPTAAHMTDAEAEAERVRRHRERQRKKRAFGRAVRYQSRRAYAEIRPRIKGRFVTPEEYAVYQAQQAGGMAPVEGMEAEDPTVPAAAANKAADKAAAFGGYMAPPPAVGEVYAEEDAVVPMPAFVA